MIKIHGPGDARPLRRTTKASNSQHAFRAGDNAPPSTSALGTASAPSTLSALIALQSADTPGRKTFAAAQRILTLLDALRLDILNGAMSRSDLEILAAATQIRAHAEAEPRLISLYDEINLRARVELAKLGE